MKPNVLLNEYEVTENKKVIIPKKIIPKWNNAYPLKLINTYFIYDNYFKKVSYHVPQSSLQQYMQSR